MLWGPYDLDVSLGSLNVGSDLWHTATISVNIYPFISIAPSCTTHSGESPLSWLVMTTLLNLLERLFIPWGVRSTEVVSSVVEVNLSASLNEELLSDFTCISFRIHHWTRFKKKRRTRLNLHYAIWPSKNTLLPFPQLWYQGDNLQNISSG